MKDIIIDPDTIDFKLLEGKESQTVVIDHKYNQDPPILLDALGANAKVLLRTKRLYMKSRT